MTGPQGPTGSTGPAGPPANGSTGGQGAVQISAGDTQGTLLGSQLFRFDGVHTITLNSQTISGQNVAPSSGLSFNNNLIVSPSSVYTPRNTVDDGNGNGSVLNTFSVTSLTGTNLYSSNSITTRTLSVNGNNLVKPIYGLIQTSNSSSGGLTFGSILFQVGGTFTAGGQSLTLPTLSTTTSYLVTLAGTGIIPVSLTTATLIINAPLASVTTLYIGSVNNYSSSSSQSATTQSESILTVSSGVSCVVSCSTAVFTSFGGRLSVTQLI